MDNDLQYVRVASKIIGQPLLVMPSVAQEIGDYIRSRQTGSVAPQSSRLAGKPRIDPHDAEKIAYRIDGSVAVCSVVGELVNRGAYLGANSGLVSYEGFQETIRLAGQDPEVRSIVYDEHSPGGEAYGMVDAAKSLKALANGKPLIAVVNSLAASAAYGLACGADEIVIGESGMVGSIGVVVLHMDHSAVLKDMGLRATFVHAGKKKVLGNGFESLSDIALEHIQGKVDEVMTGFVDLVVGARSKLTADDVYNFEADTFYGQKAIDAGLADRIGTVQSVVAELNRAQSGRSPSQEKGISMSDSEKAPAEVKSVDTNKTDIDAALTAAKEQGVAQGRDEQTQRYQAVLGAKDIKGDGKRMAAALDFLQTADTMDADKIKSHVLAHTPASGSSDGDEQIDYDNLRTLGSDLVTPEGKSQTSPLSAATDRHLGLNKA